MQQPAFTVDQAPGLLGQLGYVGVFLLGAAALGYVIVWVVKMLRGSPILTTGATMQQPGALDAEIKLLIMGAVYEIKQHIENVGGKNRHDARNSLTGVASKVDQVHDDLVELRASADRLESFLQRLRPPT